MKTVSEFKDEQKRLAKIFKLEQERLAEEKIIKENNDIKKLLKDFPPNENRNTPDQILIIRERIANKQLKFSGICCDFCGYEVVQESYNYRYNGYEFIQESCVCRHNSPYKIYFCPSCGATFR